MKSVHKEPARDVPVLGEWDVVVCGGGPAGCAAAVASARQGARTLLVEKEGYLGGSPCTQLVCVILSTNGVDFQGIWHEYTHGLRRRNGIRSFMESPSHTNIRSSVNPEAVKRVWDELLSEAGVEMLHHAYGCVCLIEEGRATGVFAETRAGRRLLLAKRVIDATGDGLVAAQSGVAYEAGDGEHPWAMAMTKVFRMGNIHQPELPLSDETMARVEAAFTAALERGEYDSPVLVEKRRFLGYVRGWAWPLPEPRREMLSVLSRVLKVDPLDPFDCTRAEREGRAQAWQAADAMKRFAPGYEQSYLLDTSNQIGIRSSRRLRGLATVTDEDARDFRKYPDGIARSSWDLDVWPADSYTKPAVPRGEAHYLPRQERMKAGDYFDIRYGCLVAEGVDNLLMAGRCISAGHSAESSLRIQQTCMATGEAAGTTAALSLAQRTTPREMDPMRVVDRLEKIRAQVSPAWP